MNIRHSPLKISSLILAFTGIVFSLSAQTPDCNDDRYANPDYFTSVKKTSNIVYGSNKGVGTGTNETLRLDVYEPEGDSLSARPLIIFAHGGSFVGGSRGEANELCISFARMGYVTVTIDYRTGFFLPNERTTTLAVLRAMHDMKAAIRFFRKDAANGNTYGVDTSRIIIGGISAGAITAIHVAYLDQESEIPSYFTPSDTAGLGGIEGLSGNPGFSSKANAVVNFAGAIGDTSWIVPGDIPITSFHYDGDVTVPYDTREVSVQGFPTGLTASGSGTMKIRLDHVGVVNELRTFTGSGHVEFLSGTDYDSVVNSTMMFLYDNVSCKSAATAIAPDERAEGDITVSPNPSDGNFILRFAEMPHPKSSVIVYNSLGQEVFRSGCLLKQEMTLDLRSFRNGMYVISVTNQDGQPAAFKKVVVQ